MGDILTATVFDVFQFVRTVTLETLEILGSTRLGVGQRGFSCDEYLVFHRSYKSYYTILDSSHGSSSLMEMRSCSMLSR